MAHNLVYFDSSTNSIQQFSNAQLDDLAERVLRVMASGTYTGSITVGTSNPIGTFADTALVDAAGGTNTTVVTNTYTLSQVSTATLGASSDPPMHVGLDVSNPTTTVLQENLTTKEQLADEIISRMVSGTGGTNAYYLATSAPADGATWVSRGTLLDTITNNTVTVTNYKLWQRTTSGAIITNRDPVKLSSGNIQSFTTAEINALIKTIEERIIATGIGTYVLQASAPVTGTWANAGTVVDTREDVSGTSYEGAATYVNENALSYETNYTLTTSYTNEDVTSFIVSYLNEDVTSFVTTYDGPSYVLSYLGNTPYLSTYLGPTNFTNTFFFGLSIFYVGPPGATQYQGNEYSGPARNYTAENALSFDGTIFFGFPRDVPYDGGLDYQGQAFGSTYLGPQNFDVTYLGPVTYDGDVDYLTVYQGPNSYDGLGNYDASTVAPTTSTISTRTLWRRVA